MRILILGGTVFLGRALVDAALARGHTLTLFNRGHSHPDLFPHVEQLHGDRSAGLEALQGRGWDAVVDTSGYVPRVVGASARLLADAVARYAFVSTISVYADVSRPGIDERAPVGVLADATTEEVTGETYGPLKALCEQAVEDALPGRALVVRPGLIVGPHDPTDRFTYWPVRVAAGGEVLAPGRPARSVQFIDVRDLAEWLLHMLETGGTGIYNATGAPERTTMGDLLATCADVPASAAIAGEPARFTWVDEQFLLDQGVEPWMGLPLWLPEIDPSTAGMFAVDVSRALAAGLAFRPLAGTVRATLDWAATRPADHTWRAGLTRAREAELLAAWHKL